MSGFFSLGGSGKEQQQEQEQEDHHQHQHQHHHHHHHHHQDATNSLYLFKNEEIYNKGFELWQQHYQLQQQQQQRLQHHQDVDFSVGPSRRNIISSGSGSTGGGDDSSNYRSGFGLMRQQQGIVVGSGSSNSGGGGGGMNCQDCGNQAKKDCSHLRCRSCCKSRGFQCSTHVKSTWVPAAKRRERQNQLASLQQQQPQPQPQQQQQQQLSLRGEISKRPRENPSSSSLARLPPSTSGLEVGHFPAELNTPAVFRCVRVSAMDDAEEQYAYQTAVNIGGHVFKGILYDQGVENRYAGGGGGESSSGGGGGGAHQQQPPLNLIASTSAAVTTSTRSTNVVPMFDQCPTPLTAFLAGTQFFPPPRS